MIASLQTVLPHQDQRLAARQLDQQVDQVLVSLAAMTVGDPAARDTIRQGFDLLAQLAMVTGIFPADVYPARLTLHLESGRVLNEGRPPSWWPDPEGR